MQKVNVDSLDKDGTSALTWALWSADCPPTIELLIDATSNFNIGGGVYGCPLGAASRYCSSKIVKMLLDNGANPNVIGGNYGSCVAALLHRPFNSAVFEDDLLCLELLLSKGAKVNTLLNDGRQALHVAARYCYHPEVFDMLLRYGADVNATFESHQRGFQVLTTPLGVLCDFHIRETATKILLKAGASPNCYTPSGKTALQSACNILGSSEIVQELIVRGADIEARSLNEEATALHAAATAARSDLAWSLIKKGANIDARDKQKRTPLHNACWREPRAESQQENVKNHFEVWGDPYEMEKSSEMLGTIEMLLTVGHAAPNARDENGATPLHHAVKARNPATVETLIRLASRDIVVERDFGGKLPLHWAAEAGFANGLDSLVNFRSHIEDACKSNDIKQLKDSVLAFWKYINARDSSGSTALHYAAKNGHEEFIKELLGCHMFTDIDVRNCHGYTAFDLARKYSHVWAARVLKDAAR